MTEAYGPPPRDHVDVLPAVVLSQTFPAHTSSIPEIHDFVQRGLAESPLTEQDNHEIQVTVFRALLDAAGPAGTIRVSFRICPDIAEVLPSNPRPGDQPSAATPMASAPLASYPADPLVPVPGEPATLAADATFGEWMSSALSRTGLTQEAAARQLSVSVKTVGRWVGGKTEPRLRDLRRIKDLFGELPFPT